MTTVRTTRLGWLLILACLGAASARAEVTRLELKTRTDVPGFNYEKIVGRLHFAVDPANPRNRIVVDLDKAQQVADGRVEFSADFYMLRPKSGGAGTALVDIVNRGRLTFGRFAAGAGSSDPDIGDGFLMTHGFTIVAVGWEFDVTASDGLLRLDAPPATNGRDPLTGMVTGYFVPDRREPLRVTALSGYVPADPASPDSVLAVRNRPASAPQRVARDRWTISPTNVVTLTGGFEPGHTYEITYHAANPPVAGLGFAAVRDVVSWLRRGGESAAPVRFAYAFGASQSGRFLREFLYEGFNTDERGARVFDGVLAHIAGAGRLDVNSRWSTPIECCSTNSTSFPFSTAAQRDPVSGLTEGLLENGRARLHPPKLFLINTGVEYWSSSGRAAALTHTTPDGARDVAEPANVRIYLMAGTQHGTGPFPPTRGAGQELLNPTNQSWVLRALLVAMDQWARNGIEPPVSQHPRLDSGTLVEAKDVAFPLIAGVQSPRGLTAGARVANAFLTGGGGVGATLPLLVPQVDADGNERAGIKVPEVAVPLATYTGWNFRDPSVGAPDQLYPLLGSYIPFARTKAERDARRDPRRSVAERHVSRDEYLAKIRTAAAMLVKGRYMLDRDVPAAVGRAAAHWDLIMEAGDSGSR
jgi:hypothetical protein